MIWVLLSVLFCYLFGALLLNLGYRNYETESLQRNWTATSLHRYYLARKNESTLRDWWAIKEFTNSNEVSKGIKKILLAGYIFQQLGNVILIVMVILIGIQIYEQSQS